MALGFLLEDGLGFVNGTTTSSTRVTPDKTMSRAGTPKVFLATFGDGYEQRAPDGLNNVKEEYSLTFNNRNKEEIDAIVATFELRKGVTAFDLTIPATNADGTAAERSVRVVCHSYSHSYDSDNFYSCTATFRRVYES